MAWMASDGVSVHALMYSDDTVILKTITINYLKELLYEQAKEIRKRSKEYTDRH